MLIRNFQSSLRKKKNVLMQFSKFFEKKCLYILLPIKAKMQFSKFQSYLKKKMFVYFGAYYTKANMQFSKFFEKNKCFYAIFKVL
jgi:hypothetical protein